MVTEDVGEAVLLGRMVVLDAEPGAAFSLLLLWPCSTSTLLQLFVCNSNGKGPTTALICIAVQQGRTTLIATDLYPNSTHVERA